MTWLKLDTTLPTHDRIIDLEPAARWFYVASLCYAAEHLTDGHIRAARLRYVDITCTDPEAQAAALVVAGLWVTNADGWEIVNYLEHQRSAEEVRRQRAAAKERAARSREVRAHAQRTHDARSPKVREQSRGEKNTHTAPVIHSDPQVIHRCAECDQPITTEGCYCTDKDHE